ncbi:hypothetical protein CGH56_23400 [Vibrio parahaemolyticus]|nr:hypothetical protein CGH56_23400 [Vibrio parahaemolyticus]
MVLVIKAVYGSIGVACFTP